MSTLIKSLVVKCKWAQKYRLYHIPLWIIYHYVWWTLGIGSALEAANSIFFSVYSIKFTFYVIFQAAGVYFNLYFLIPRYLEQGKYIQYIGGVLVTIFCTASTIVTGYYISVLCSEQTFQELYNMAPSSYFRILKDYSLPSTIASMTLAMSIKLTKNWIYTKRRQQFLEKKQQLLEKENLETELKFLKSQFNPHFLFNTINSIFVLIYKDQAMASESLAKFSDLLRYQLYECNEQQIPLGRELNYLENFIELEKLRQDRNFELTFHTKLEYLSNLTIAPFILIPFVENAFKHVSQWQDETNWIKIDLSINQHRLQINVSNSVSTYNNFYNTNTHCGGIGLKNVRRRLDLIYPERYDLEIKQNEACFQISLELELHTQAISQLVLAN